MIARRSLLASLALAGVVLPALAFTQQPATRPAGRAPMQRPSPSDVASNGVNGSRVTIYYCRPHTADPKTHEPRKIWGGLVPYGQVWRMGANDATLLVTQQPLTIGDKEIPAGVYSLYMLPAEDGAKLIVNKQVGQWGVEYHEEMDLARVDMKRAEADPAVEQFTIQVTRDGQIKATWANASYSVPFTVKK